MTSAELADLAVKICPNAPLDLGIVRAVHILREAGIHTLESCEGGERHAFAEPSRRSTSTVRQETVGVPSPFVWITGCPSPIYTACGM
jgi:hypothetical protein